MEYVAERTSNLLGGANQLDRWSHLIFSLNEDDLSHSAQTFPGHFQKPSSRTDVFLSAPFNSSSFITPWGEPSNSWAFESTLLDQRFPVEHELDKHITPSTNSKNWQHTKCLHHGPRIYAEYILHCYRTTNQNACSTLLYLFSFSLRWPAQRLALNSSFIKLLIKNLTTSSFFSFIFLRI